MIIPRSVATQGLAFGPLGVATQGFVSGIYVQLGGMGQVVAFGLPTISVEAGALEIQVPSLLTLIGFGTPTISGGATVTERLFVRLTSAVWSLLNRSPWRN